MSRTLGNPDQIPCKIVVIAPPGTDIAATRQRVAQVQGELGQFYRAAHQAWNISSSPSHHQLRELSEGKLRYVNNAGQETLFIELAAPPKPEKKPEKKPKKGGWAVLSIDIILDTAPYKDVDILIDGELAVEQRTWRFMRDMPSGAVLRSSGGDPIEALQGVPQPRKDDALWAGVNQDVWIPPESLSTTPRVYLYADGNVEGGYPCSFLVVPEQRGLRGEIVVDVYLASFMYTTVRRRDQEDEHIHIDELTYRINVREFPRQHDLAYVSGTVSAGQRFEQNYPPPPFDEIDENFDTLGLPGFFAQKSWVDQGGAPASPDAPGMGRLLAHSPPRTKSVVGAPVIPPDAETTWEGPVANMTQIATVRWTPAPDPAIPGRATIELT